MGLVYTNLKSGDKVQINPGNLEIKVLEASGGVLKIETPYGIEEIDEGINCNLGGGIYLHNYGSRKEGHFNHVRFKFYRSIHYDLSLRRNGQKKLLKFAR